MVLKTSLLAKDWYDVSYVYVCSCDLDVLMGRFVYLSINYCIRLIVSKHTYKIKMVQLVDVREEAEVDFHSHLVIVDQVLIIILIDGFYRAIRKDVLIIYVDDVHQIVGSLAV